MTEDGCHFCDQQERFRRADVYIENDFCIFFAAMRDHELRAEAVLPPDVLPGSGAIIPIAHLTSPFDFSADEWAATHDLLIKGRQVLHDLLAPDGYTLGWNDVASLHAHLHVLPRFHDEPMWDQGVRSAINVAENRRPDPWRPGTGQALSGPLTGGSPTRRFRWDGTQGYGSGVRPRRAVRGGGTTRW
jgi:diadenosine tetraphosphate (Ap4A) HIT family hydrolase